MLNLFFQISFLVFLEGRRVCPTLAGALGQTPCARPRLGMAGRDWAAAAIASSSFQSLLASCLHPGGLRPRPGWKHRGADCSQHSLAVEACPLAFTLGSRPGVVLTLASWDRVHLGTMPAQGRLQASVRLSWCWHCSLSPERLERRPGVVLGRAKRNSVGPSVPTLGLRRGQGPVL